MEQIIKLVSLDVFHASGTDEVTAQKDRPAKKKEAGGMRPEKDGTKLRPKKINWRQIPLLRYLDRSNVRGP
jgi:hypothetical protein